MPDARLELDKNGHSFVVSMCSSVLLKQNAEQKRASIFFKSSSQLMSYDKAAQACSSPVLVGFEPQNPDLR